jgi:pyrimidine-nucleoside phosphorylase
MRAVDLIRKKRDGQTLELAEIDAFVAGATSGEWPDYQVSALLMAIVLRGMTADETARLTTAMVRSGVKLDLSEFPGAKVDKHSTGGVGDKTSLVLAPLAAACGLVVPMMSGRGLGHTGGTLDKLEAIPGFRVGLSLDEFRQALRKVGCALIGQTSEIAPADKKLYALRDVTATVESIPLISASIMSKKIAEGIDALQLDVKVGRGAFMKNLINARRLAESLVRIGEASGVRTAAMLTAMDQPLGNAVGNALEVIEAIETLKGRGPADLTSLSVSLAAGMVYLAGKTSWDSALERVKRALASGRGLEKFREIIAQQGGDPQVVEDYNRFPQAPHRMLVRAPRSGYVTGIDAELVGRASVLLGAGRNRVEDAVDPSVGLVLRVHEGERVRAGDGLLELHYGLRSRLEEALRLMAQAFVVEGAPRPLQSQILETIGSG